MKFEVVKSCVLSRVGWDYSRRVGDEVPGVVVVLCDCMGGWVGRNSRSTSAE